MSGKILQKKARKLRYIPSKKKFGKIHTVIKGIDDKDIDLKDVTKKLKNILACGGTFKDGKIELQGKHKQRVKAELVKLGFPQETLFVK